MRQVLNAQEVAKHYRLFKVLRDDVSEALHLPPRERYVSFAELAQSRDLLELYASRGDDHPATAEMKRLYGNLLRYESVANRSAFTIAAAGVTVSVPLAVVRFVKRSVTSCPSASRIV